MIVKMIKKCIKTSIVFLLFAYDTSVIHSEIGRKDKNIKIVNFIAELSADMVLKCPISKPEDSAAFIACRNALYDGSLMRRSLSARALWGGLPSYPDAHLKEYNSTQLAPEILSGMYLSLFMYTGKSKVEFSETEGLYRAEFGVAFRNRLEQGEFPYPFWHDQNKWSQYQDTNSIILWINPEKMKIVGGQYTPNGSIEVVDKSLGKTEKMPYQKFDGNWTWVDVDGQQQPKLSQFGAIFSPKNPFLSKLDIAYKEFALSLRDGDCLSCHVPNNPDKMKKLVLMQTPRDAAAEIGRILDDVRHDKMPLTKGGIEDPLDKPVKDIFLTRGEVFNSTILAAREWEELNRGK